MSNFNPQPKFNYLRSQTYLNLIRSLHCCNCSISPRSEAAHSNQGRHGKGKGIKASDEFTIPLCKKCHAIYDQNKNRLAFVEWFNMRHGMIIHALKMTGDLPKNVEELLIERGVL